MIIIAPSILSADGGRLADEIAAVENAGADWIHIDVMDGHFVPNITIGPAIISSLRKTTKLPFDVHLMIKNPENYIEAFAAAGADIITVHVEAANHLHRTIDLIKKSGKKAGVSLNPATPLTQVEEIIPDIDLLLIMTVNPGFGGQQFIKTTLPKIAKARKLIDALANNTNSQSKAYRDGEEEATPHTRGRHPAYSTILREADDPSMRGAGSANKGRRMNTNWYKPLLEVDGGVTLKNIKSIAQAGAQVMVAGSSVFSSKDYKKTISELKAAIKD
jgi:ribulose-phosphate 3-epimerase